MPNKSRPEPIHLKDYKETPFLIEDVYLTFYLHPTATRVESKLAIKKRPHEASGQPLCLHGEKLKLKSLRINGQDLDSSKYQWNDSFLIIDQPPDEFTLEVETEIAPQNNTALEGLYITDGIFCTQNESEGFRKITYFYDRPDILSKFTTKIVEPQGAYPTLLSNGNFLEEGKTKDGRRFVVWQDPFPKPCYLFALVAGDLDCVQDRFKTMSGREIDLRIYVDKGNGSKSNHAMQSLKNAMKWDEARFGRECDLDTYMIVAVSAFNFGAMENKGLNIFNSQYVLADAATATDQNFEDIESVVGHEYFHNWSGNRVTCRDWFQITLKEGLTIFRDQEFSADMSSRAVKRIADVRILRDYQFVEDAGPNAHPIQPKSYIEVNNFYTTTVYQKGSEVIRMIHTLVGEEAFRKGMDYYFKTYDGKAVTTEEFVGALEKGSGMDLKQFRRWYDQVGTPECFVESEFDPNQKTYKLIVRQDSAKNCPKDAASSLHFPLTVGLIDPDGQSLNLNLEGNDIGESAVLEIRSEKEEFVFSGIDKKPVPSLLRNFSAPVRLHFNYSPEELSFLFDKDTDLFNRYDAGQRYSKSFLKALVNDVQANRDLAIGRDAFKPFRSALLDTQLDGLFKSYAISIPSMISILEELDQYDVTSVFEAREYFLLELAKNLESELESQYHENQTRENYQYDQEGVSQRAIKNTCLGYLHYLKNEKYDRLAHEQLTNADNMTDCIAALAILSQGESSYRQTALQSFYEQWKKNALVMNKWFAVQASSKSKDVLARLKELEKSPVFDMKNPNKLRALYGVFTQNLVRFHDPSGNGYQWIAERILEIDAFNPKAAAHLATGFKKFSSLPKNLKSKMKKQLENILVHSALSGDTYEIVSNTLKKDEEVAPAL